MRPSIHIASESVTVGRRYPRTLRLPGLRRRADAEKTRTTVHLLLFPNLCRCATTDGGVGVEEVFKGRGVPSVSSRGLAAAAAAVGEGVCVWELSIDCFEILEALEFWFLTLQRLLVKTINHLRIDPSSISACGSILAWSFLSLANTLRHDVRD